VLFRGGRRDAEVLLAELDAVGLGVEDIFIAASSCDMSDMFAVETEAARFRDKCSSRCPNPIVADLERLYFLYAERTSGLGKECVFRGCEWVSRNSTKVVYR
jgi:hypothetical protein